MRFDNKHLCTYDKYIDWVNASNTFSLPNVSYLTDKLAVVYWISIETIWGLTIGGYWQSAGNYRLGSGISVEDALILGVPSVPDGIRITNMSYLCSSLPNVEEVAMFNMDNVTNMLAAFRGCSKLERVFHTN